MPIVWKETGIGVEAVAVAVYVDVDVDVVVDVVGTRGNLVMFKAVDEQLISQQPGSEA